jgi:peptide-methionine (S)-S-oxide reductase
MKRIALLLSLSLMVLSCANSQQNDSAQVAGEKEKKITYPEGVVPVSEIDEPFEGLSRAVFAGGCFWCVEAVFERVEGVEEAISGYAGGTTPDPTYRKVASGATDYAESVIVYYDEKTVSYNDLLTAFFAGHDPTQLNRQGPDVGPQYRSAIFYADEQERELAEAYIQKLEEEGKFDKPIVTKLSPLSTFYTAEGYHQDYIVHNPNQPYVVSVSKPKIKKFMKAHPELLKQEYKP